MQFSRQEYKKKYQDIQIYCIICTNFIIKNNRITYKQYLKQKFCSLDCKGLWQAEFKRGKNNPNFKHGLSTFWEILRGSSNYRKWRKAIFERDNYVCQHCGIKGGELNAHHIKPFSLYPELRFELINGLTLCRDCHQATDTYGKKLGEHAYSI